MRRSDRLRQAACAISRRHDERGLIAGQDGIASVRLADGLLLVTLAGLSNVNVCPPVTR